jgi:hypothetical protein
MQPGGRVGTLSRSAASLTRGARFVSQLRSLSVTAVVPASRSDISAESPDPAAPGATAASIVRPSPATRRHRQHAGTTAVITDPDDVALHLDMLRRLEPLADYDEAARATLAVIRDCYDME